LALSPQRRKDAEKNTIKKNPPRLRVFAVNAAPKAPLWTNGILKIEKQFRTQDISWCYDLVIRILGFGEIGNRIRGFFIEAGEMNFAT